MPDPTQSYRKVAYDLRPAKQVERRMMFDTLQILSRAGFDIGDYQYTGFGSVFFVDFLLFHKYLGVTKLLNVEHDTSIEKRVRFNRPFDLIEVEMKSASEVLPTLSKDRLHILWLDYDDYLQDWMLRDTYSAMGQLSPGSIFLATIDVDPPVRPGDAAEWEQYFRTQGGYYVPHDWSTESFGREKLPGVVQELVRRAIEAGIAYRTDVRFAPLFSFLYADTHMMYTVGGMLATEREMRQLRKAALENTHYIRRSLKEDPYRIIVPNLTRKERMYLDAKMPSAPTWSPPDFELEDWEITAYRDNYRFFPTYVEVF